MRENRRQEQVVAALRTAEVAVPGAAVAGADVEQVGLGVVGHGVPGGAAAAVLPPLAGPGLGRHGQLGMLERLRRIAGHREEAPRQPAGRRVVGRDVAADGVLGAAVADDHLALHDARRAGDRVRLLEIDRRLHVPHGRAGVGVERHQAAVEQAHEHEAVVERDAAVHGAAAEPGAAGRRQLRDPTSTSCRRCARRGRTPCSTARWRRARRSTTSGVVSSVPGMPSSRGPRAGEAGDGRRGDLCQRAVVRLGLVAPVGEPLGGRRRPQRLRRDGGWARLREKPAETTAMRPAPITARARVLCISR